MLTDMGYPLTVTNGDLTLVSDDETIYRNLIISFLDTRLGERLMLPKYGIKEPLFEPLDDFLSDNSLLALRLEQWIPAIRCGVQIDYNNSGEIVITVKWALNITDKVNGIVVYTWD
jgi:phage baseplate assembly protein W